MGSDIAQTTIAVPLWHHTWTRLEAEMLTGAGLRAVTLDTPQIRCEEVMIS